jgi:NAD(P)-dependent dehydrogenase (short-subunit alcohol dehydrogenase family)
MTVTSGARVEGGAVDLLIAGKRFLVVGGTSGMGLAAAKAIGGEGAAVAVVGRDPDRAAAAAAEVAAAGASAAHGLPADVSADGGAVDVVARATELLGGLDGVVVTTGLIGHEPIEIPDERWIEVFRDVLLGTVRVVDAALPELVRSQGSVVTTAAYSIRAPDIARLPYASMKSAVATFTKGIARTYGRQGVRANCIAPGAIETAALTEIRRHIADTTDVPYDEALERVMVDEWGLDIALGRPGRPEEVGALIAFLVSPVAAYLTGALVNIDGGTNF